MVAHAANEVADAARRVGIHFTERYDNPEQRASLLDLLQPRLREVWTPLACFYVVAELISTTATPTSLSGLPMLLAPPTQEEKLPYVLWYGPQTVHTAQRTGSGSARTWIIEDALGLGYGRTQPTIELRRPVLAVEGELSLAELLSEVSTPPQARTTVPRSKAFRAFTELRRWLRLTATEAADLIGVKRTTPNAWQREGREPRPASARRLYQLHSIVSSLVRKLGENEAIRWLETGDPSPREQLLRGELGVVARSAEALVIGRQPLPGPPPGALIEDPERVGVPSVPRIRRRRRHRGGSNG
jgi:DNA-binding XRE family transcriptional regulator